MNCNNILNSIDKIFCEATNGFRINKEYFERYLNYIYNDSKYYDVIIKNNTNNIAIIEIVNNYKISYYNSYNFLYILFIIFCCDRCLVKIFGNKSRWFQLHSLINLIISVNIYPEFLNISTIHIENVNNNPYLKLTPLIKSYNSSFYIIALHLYHIIGFKNLTYYDYFHHILFVLCGVVPCFLYLETNQYVMAYIACAGIPGIFEYGSLSLYKNEKITILTQKKINSYLYIYFRYPLCVFGVTINYINYNSNLLKDNLILTLYLNCLLFFNGSLFTFLTLESYFRILNNRKNKDKSNSIISSNKTIKCE
tara:strand:- start:2255 stop:3181 length:927 start_codon:yes stop_codon:yes gene_type:complete